MTYEWGEVVLTREGVVEYYLEGLELFSCDEQVRGPTFSADEVLKCKSRGDNGCENGEKMGLFSKRLKEPQGTLK